MAGVPIEILIKALGGDQVIAELKKATNELMNVKKAATETSTSMTTFANTSKSAVGNFTPQMTAASKGATDFSGALKNSNPALHDFSKAMHEGAAGAPKLTTALDQTAQKTTTLTERGRNLSASFQSMTTSTVALTGSAIALFETWDSVSDAELAVAKSRNSLEQATIRLHSFEAQRNKLIEEGKTGTEQYAIIEEKLALQHNKVETATGDLANAQENLAIIQTHFGKEVIPLVMSAGASMFQLFTTGKQGILEMAKSFQGLIPAIRGAASSFSLISLTNPFFLALTIGGALIGAFVTNLFGFRDAVNGVGVAIGNALPFLRPFLEMLGAAGQWLTDTFNGGAQEAQAFEGEFSGSMQGATTAVQGFGTDAITAIDGVSSATLGLATSTGQAVNLSAEYLGSLVKRFQETKTQLQNTFSRTVPLGPGASVEGISGVSNLDTKPQPASEFFSSQYGKGGPNPGANPFRDQVDSVKGLQEAMRALTDVTVFYDETEKILYYDQNQLNAAVEKGTITTEQYNQIQQVLGQHFQAAAISGKANVGMYDQLGDSLNVLTGVSKPLVDLTAAQTIATAQHTSQMQKLNEEFNNNWAVLNSATSAQDLYAQGQKQLQIDLMAANIELASAGGYWAAYNQALGTTSVQISEFNQGVVKQTQTFVQSKVNVLQTAGAYSALVEQMKTGEPQTIAYTQAVYDQKIALEQSKIEIYALQGTLDTLTQQYQSGEASVVAFNQGFVDQKTELINSALAVDTTRGAIAALTEDMESGQAQIVAWNTGLAEGRLATQQQALDVEQAAGSLQAYQESIASGVAEQTAFSGAIWETNRAVAEAFVNLEASRGALQEYTHLMGQGIPQFNAYNQAILDAQMANAQLDETIFSTLGTYQEQLKALNDTTIQSQKAGLAFLEGNNSALKWAEGIKTMEQANDGVIVGLAEMGKSFRYHIPHTIAASEESVKNLIVAFGNVKAASMEMASESHQAGLELTSGIADAIREGGKEVDESLDELSTKVGVEFPDSVKEGLTSANLGQAMTDTMNEGIDMARTAWEGGAKKIDVERFVSDLGDRYQDSFKQLGPHMQQQASQVMKLINNELAKGPKEGDPQGIENWLNRIKSLVALLPESIDPAIGKIGELSSVDFSAATAQLMAYKAAIDSTVAAYKTFEPNPNMTLQTGGSGVGVGLGSKTTEGVGDAGTLAPDTSAIDAAQAKLDTFKTALSGLPAHIAGVITQSNASFVPLGDPFLNEIPTKILNFSNTLSQMPSFVIESVVGPVNSSLIALGDPFLNEIPQKVLQFSQTLAQLPGFVASNVVSPIISNFTGMANALQSGPFTKIQRDSAVAFQAVTNIARTEAAKLSTIFDAAIQNAISKFSQLQSSVAGVMSSIVSSASNARSSVESLADSINSLQDRTVTITTRYETIGSPSSAASGFGPTIVDHPTRLLVGESGPEYVQVTPLASSAAKNLSPDKRLDMFADPGKKRMNTAPLFELATGTTTDPFGNNNFNVQTTGGSTTTGTLPNTLDWVDINIMAVGGRNVSAFGGAIPIYGNSSSGGGSGSGGGGSSGGGSGGGGGGSGSSGGGSGSSGGGNGGGGGSSGVSQDRWKWSDYDSSTLQTSGSGSRWGGDVNSDPATWNVIPMVDDPSKWKVVDSNGKNIAVGFTSEDQARGFVEDKVSRKGYNDISSPDFVDANGNWGNRGGDSSSGGGGDNSGGGGNGPVGGNITGDRRMLGEGGDDYYNTVTGYSVPSYIQSPGHGATNAAKWTNPNVDPRSWTAEPMIDKSSKDLWKVVDDKGVNIAAKFKSEDEANEFIQEHIFAVYGGPGGTEIGFGGGDNEVGGGGSTPSSGGSTSTTPKDYSSYKSASTGYLVPQYIQTSGGSKWKNPNLDPNKWQAVSMTNDPSKWKVVDDKGVIITANFNSEMGANEFIQEHVFAYNGGGGFDFDNGGGSSNNTSPISGGSRSSSSNIVSGNNDVFNNSPAFNHPVFNQMKSTGAPNIQQSQIVSQNSIVNQGNNSNIDLMSGTNSRLRIQNGVVVEATGIYAGYNGSGGSYGNDGLPGGGLNPLARTGSILEPLRGRYRSGQDNQFGIFDNSGAAPLTDVGVTPCQLTPTGGVKPPGGGGPGFPGFPNGFPNGADMAADIINMVNNIISKVFGQAFNINMKLDGDTVYKNQVKRMNSNLATYMN